MNNSLLKYTRMTLYSLALAVLFFSCTSTKTTTKKAAPEAKPEMANIAPGLETQILELINKHRESKGLAPLQINFIVSAEARRHSMNMATKRVAFGHNGLSARTKIITSKIKGVSSVAENVAYGNLTAQQAVQTWLNSAGHRKNIEGNYAITGIGVARNQNSQLYFTQIFAK